MVAHAQRQDAFIDSQSLDCEDEIWCFAVDWFYDEFFIVERNVSNFTPRESNFRCQSKKQIHLQKERGEKLFIMHFQFHIK